MTTQDVHKALTAAFPGSLFEYVEGAKHPVSSQITGDDFIVVPTDKIVDICRTLMGGQFGLGCLSNLTAVDRKDRFEVIYHLFNYQTKQTVELKVYLPRDDNAHVASVENLWGCANWLEREVYDLFGVKFDGNTDLRRIMLPDDWIGHPLRKDYKEQEDYHGISTTRPSLLQ